MALVAAEMPPMRFHDLRHVAASLMSAAGVPLKAQMAYLGHSKAYMTLDYTHVGEADTRQAAETLGRVLRPAEMGGNSGGH